MNYNKSSEFVNNKSRYNEDTITNMNNNNLNKVNVISTNNYSSIENIPKSNLTLASEAYLNQFLTNKSKDFLSIIKDDKILDKQFGKESERIKIQSNIKNNEESNNSDLANKNYSKVNINLEAFLQRNNNLIEKKNKIIKEKELSEIKKQNYYKNIIDKTSSERINKMNEFYNSQKKLQENKEININVKRKQDILKLQSECTFKPKVDKNSVIMFNNKLNKDEMIKRLNNIYSEHVNEKDVFHRLYKKHFNSQIKKKLEFKSFLDFKDSYSKNKSYNTFKSKNNYYRNRSKNIKTFNSNYSTENKYNNSNYFSRSISKYTNKSYNTNNLYNNKKQNLTTNLYKKNNIATSKNSNYIFLYNLINEYDITFKNLICRCTKTEIFTINFLYKLFCDIGFIEKLNVDYLKSDLNIKLNKDNNSNKQFDILKKINKQYYSIINDTIGKSTEEVLQNKEKNLLNVAYSILHNQFLLNIITKVDKNLEVLIDTDVNNSNNDILETNNLNNKNSNNVEENDNDTNYKIQVYYELCFCIVLAVLGYYYNNIIDKKNFVNNQDTKIIEDFNSNTKYSESDNKKLNNLKNITSILNMIIKSNKNNSLKFTINLPYDLCTLQFIRNNFLLFSQNKSRHNDYIRKQKSEIKILSIKTEVDPLNYINNKLNNNSKSGLNKKNYISHYSRRDMNIGDYAQYQIKRKNKKIEEYLKNKKEKDIKECTFQPKLSPIPNYFNKEFTHIDQLYTKNNISNYMINNVNTSVKNYNYKKSYMGSTVSVLNKRIDSALSNECKSFDEITYEKQKLECSFKPKITNFNLNKLLKNPLLSDSKLQESLSKKKEYVNNKEFRKLQSYLGYNNEDRLNKLLESKQKDIIDQERKNNFFKNSDKIKNSNLEVASLSSNRIDIYLNSKHINKNIAKNSLLSVVNKPEIYNKYKINKIVKDLNSSFLVKKRFDCSQDKPSKFQKNYIYDDKFNYKKNKQIIDVNNSLNKTHKNLYNLNTESSCKLKKVNYLSNNRNLNKRNPLFKLNLEVNPGVFELIIFYSDTNLDKIAYDLTLKYNLNSDKFSKLKNILITNVEKYNEDNKLI